MRFSKNPTKPTDLLDRPIHIGDIVVYPTMYARSARTTIGKITKINFKMPKTLTRHDGTTYESSVDFMTCPAGLEHQAVKYSLTIQPLVSTNRYWTARNGQQAKANVLHNVDNVVLLQESLDEIEQKLAA